MAEQAEARVFNPGRFSTMVEWTSALDLLRAGRSFGELDKAARRLPLALGGPQRLPSSTLSDLLKGRTSRQTLEVYLAVCGVPRTEMSAWLTAWSGIRSDLQPPLGAMRVRNTNPRHLGVHPAIDVEGAEGPACAYILRDADISMHGIRAKLTEASQSGGFVLLVGASSVGKTRSAFEAVRAVLAHWWLVHPASTAEIDALAEDPPQQTVIWLDELQRYLDGLSLATVRSLLQRAPHPVVLVATLWPDRYSAYMRAPLPDRPDLTAVQREILHLADIVHISETFTASETTRAVQLAHTDPRLQMALDTSDYGLPQTIAAAPMLVGRWESADPYARAVLCAAADATRLGFRSILTAPLLRAAAPGYCQPKDRAAAPPNWFERALAYATELLRGATAALVPVASEGMSMGRVDGYVMADFLIQQLSMQRRAVRPPASLWDAVLDHVRDPADLRRLADSAENRLLYQYAEPLLQRAVEVMAPDPTTGRRNASWRLAALHFRQGRSEELRQRAQNGDEDAAAWAARDLALRGQISDAVAVLRDHANTAEVFTLWITTEELITKGRVKDAMAILRVYTGDDDAYPVWRLAELLSDEDEEPELRALARSHASARWHLARLLARRHDQHQLTALAEQQDPAARWWLTELNAGSELLPSLRALLNAAPQQALPRYAHLLAETGGIDELRMRADEGERSMLHALSLVLVQQGDIVELRRRAKDSIDMLAQLADLYRDTDEIERLRELADGADGFEGSVAGSRLAELLVKLGHEEEMRARVDAGDFDAARELPLLLQRNGRPEEAARLQRYGLQADGTPAVPGQCPHPLPTGHKAGESVEGNAGEASETGFHGWRPA